MSQICKRPEAMPPIQDILTAWGNGREMGSAGIGYPSTAAFARKMRNPGRATVRAPGIGEELHGQVDQVIAGLMRRKPQFHIVILRTYLEKPKPRDSEIGKQLGCGRNEVSKIRGAAEAYIEAKLDGHY